MRCDNMQCRSDPVDVLVRNEGSVVAFHPITENARQWFNQNVQSEPWQWLGPVLVVDHGFAAGLLAGLHDEGLSTQEE